MMRRRSSIPGARLFQGEIQRMPRLAPCAAIMDGGILQRCAHQRCRSDRRFPCALLLAGMKSNRSDSVAATDGYPCTRASRGVDRTSGPPARAHAIITA